MMHSVVMRCVVMRCVVMLLCVLGLPATGWLRSSTADPRGPRGVIEREGTFACWDAGQAWGAACEISGALRTRAGLVVATDKKLENAPGHSHVWRTRLPGQGTPRITEFTAPAFLDAVKFEGMAREPCGCWCFATTSFSWFEATDPKADPWNVLVAWPAGRRDRAQVIERTVRAGKVSSIPVLPRMRRALASEAFPDGPPWFKIEGLAALPGRRLAFGIRALGKTYKDNQMVGVVLAVRYRVCRGRVSLVGPFEKIVDWDPAAVLGKPSGVSGLTYDARARRLVLLTSYEADDAKTPAHVDGWAWVLGDRRRSRRGAPQVVRAADGRPLRFRHKAEAIVRVGRDRYLVIHDDDRVFGDPQAPPAHGWPRGKHEASYAYLRLCR